MVDSDKVDLPSDHVGPGKQLKHVGFPIKYPDHTGQVVGQAVCWWGSLGAIDVVLEAP